ncbi:MAG: ATP-binding cassette domain-containing protein [Rhodovulum sp.]
MIPAFADVTFDLFAGDFMLLRGPNGVGKSTLLRALYRSYLPGGGQAILASSRGPVDLVRAADVDIAWLRRHDIGFVTQFLTARPRVSAEDLVAEPLRAAGAEPAQARGEARHWLEVFGVKPALWPAYPTTFSGGEQQKVNLARALIRPRRLLLLDEPTASLDASARAALVARLAQLRAEGVAMIGVFHHPEDVLHLVTKELALSPHAEASLEDLMTEQI